MSRPSKRPRVGVARGARDVADVPHFFSPDEGSVDAFERHALGPLLWHRPDDDELPDIPLEFRNEQHYVRSFEPVLLEETREETRNAWLESIGEGREYRVTLRSLRAVGNSGWRVATFLCADRKDCEVIKSLCPDHSVAVVALESLCSTPDPWPRSPRDGAASLACAGFVEKTTPRGGSSSSASSSRRGDAAVDASARLEAVARNARDRERRTLEAFEGVRRRVRREARRPADAGRTPRESPRRGRGNRSSRRRRRLDRASAEAESGEWHLRAANRGGSRVVPRARRKVKQRLAELRGAPPRASTSRADARRDASAD